MNLVVLHAFGSYQKGDQITDADKVAAILESEQAAYVVKVAAQEEAGVSKPKPGK
ncbi:hypothetical protein [Pandoraea apista]|uniref:Uncharacterized protein n=1 Tax=Pandoraea apista TaxID=93218 RepID=A0A5E5P3D1_9BURK|nr:hypothetical protein [Pandoraea apista]VVG70693.1 hypothetical protein PAP18089_01657 [Pandoraea apista]